MNQALDFAGDLSTRSQLNRPPKIDFTKYFQKANAETKSISWIKKYLSLIRSPGKLTIDEFFYYHLYKNEFPLEDCQSFVGKKAQFEMHAACNDSRWYAAAHDKALFYTIMKSMGLRIPETLAIVSASPRHGYALHISNLEQLGDFFDSQEIYPLFAKPIDGIFSVGTLKIESYRNGVVHLKGCGEIPIDELFEYMSRISETGYIVQKVLCADHAFAASSADVIPSVRLLVLLSGAVKINSAVIKIPFKDSIADNFWRTGNALGAIDRATGEIKRVVVNGPDGHEVVGNDGSQLSRLVGSKIPYWNDIGAQVEKAATVFPPVRTQSWDIAISSDGPVLLEFNFGGDLNLHQIAHGRGALNPEFTAHLKDCGYKGRLPLS